jgi:small subunit ribosomal protein S1
VTRVADFGAFVELEPGIEGLAHASSFPPSGRSGDWIQLVPVGTTAAFEILSVDLAQKRIGLALVEEGSSRATAARPSRGEQAELPESAARPDATHATPLGSLADKLRDALKGPRD